MASCGSRRRTPPLPAMLAKHMESTHHNMHTCEWAAPIYASRASCTLRTVRGGKGLNLQDDLQPSIVKATDDLAQLPGRRAGIGAHRKGWVRGEIGDGRATQLAAAGRAGRHGSEQHCCRSCSANCFEPAQPSKV